VLYYDSYFEKGYKYRTTTDMDNWSEQIVPVMVNSDDIMRHGSILKITESELQAFKE